jgi:hypothetical protein
MHFQHCTEICFSGFIVSTCIDLGFNPISRRLGQAGGFFCGYCSRLDSHCGVASVNDQLVTGDKTTRLVGGQQ